MSHEAHLITELLCAVAKGKPDAAEQLWGIVHDELRGIAASQMKTEAPGHLLQPTALVHEVYFRLFRDVSPQFDNRRHFFAAAARAMRQIRVDDARKRNRLKRGGDRKQAALDDYPVFEQDPVEVLAINDAIDQLAVIDQRKAEVVMLRYFSGLSVDECAAALNVSDRTIDSDWKFARAWLHRELSKDGASS